jgi:predicted unusual protein kinase regulating ubiquinone biosynthesis (AarF/ABC1/UbiB family)
MEYRKHLALLQDKAKPRPFAAVDRVIWHELGAGAEQVFAEFHPEATAAASLAQVGGRVWGGVEWEEGLGVC